MTLVLSETDDQGIVTITLNDPETRNAISDHDMIEALLAAIAAADADPKARVAILTGAGTGFSSGGNLKKMGASGGLNDKQPPKTRLNYRRGIQRLPLAFEALEIPVIAAVNGAAIGAGCDLTLMCDVRVAGESAKFAESFVKLGIVPGDGGAWLLPRVVGWSKACEMALTGDMVDAEEALRIGLVSRVVPDSELMEATREVALRIAANPACGADDETAAAHRRPAEPRGYSGSLRRLSGARPHHRRPCRGRGGDAREAQARFRRRIGALTPRRPPAIRHRERPPQVRLRRRGAGAAVRAARDRRSWRCEDT